MFGAMLTTLFCWQADGDCPSLLRRFNCDILTVHVEFASITLDGGGILMATQQFETFLDEVCTVLCSGCLQSYESTLL